MRVRSPGWRIVVTRGRKEEGQKMVRFGERDVTRNAAWKIRSGTSSDESIVDESHESSGLLMLP